MTRFSAFLTVLLLLFSLTLPAAAESADPHTLVLEDVIWELQTESLQARIQRCQLGSSECYLTTVRMRDPARQILKTTSHHRSDLATAQQLAEKLREARIIINGSGYVSPTYPAIPDNYPGTSADYYFTALGSVTVTNGRLMRRLAGVPFYGLSLQSDGLHLHNGDDPDAVLAANPLQTWSFYEKCPMILDGEIILDEAWTFASRSAARTILSKLPSGEYQILTGSGLKLTDAAHVLADTFHAVWSYNLDGGPSSALFVRDVPNAAPRLLFGARQKIVDVMGFCVLPDEDE